MNRLPDRRGFAAPRAAPPLKSPQEVRADWVAAVELAAIAARDAIAFADGADAAPSGQPGPVLTRLIVALRHLARENFPVTGFAPRVLAAAFLVQANGFIQPQGDAPAARTLIAPALAESAARVEGLLIALRNHEAGRWQGQFGDRD